MLFQKFLYHIRNILLLTCSILSRFSKKEDNLCLQPKHKLSSNKTISYF